MAKRARGTTRPGQRRPIQRGARPAADRPPAVAPEGLSPAEVTRAAELEATIVASGQASRTTTRPGAGEPAAPPQRRPGGSGRLAVEAAEEYQYVARDVRRIAVVGGSMFVILIVLFVVLVAAGVAGH
jgi:cobalamin biosynthesis Mg chelatase CobN